MQIPCSHSESTLGSGDRNLYLNNLGWWEWGVVLLGKGAGPAAASLSCGFSVSLQSSVTSSCVSRAQLMAWVREVQPPWVESHTHHFLMCHPGSAGPQCCPELTQGAWSPAWSQPEQKEDDSQVSSTSQGPGNSKAPEALWASVRTLSKYEEEETCICKACQP